MNFSLADVDRDTEPLRAFEGADLSGLARPELVQLQRLAAAARRAYDLVVAEVAAEVARRSTLDDGPGGLARQQGFATPEQFVASVLGSSVGEAAKLVNAGVSLANETQVGEGLRGNGLSVDEADLIARTLRRLDGDTRELEAKLVRLAQRLTYSQLRTACQREAARFNAAELTNRQARQFRARSLDFSEDGEGMTQVRGALDPASAAAVKTWFDAQVKAAFQARREDPSDKRLATQIRVDALVALATHGLDCEAPSSGVKAQIVVRIDRDELEHDVGVATCDALRGPISVETLRAIAVDASVLPVVMGGRSVVLDMGRSERLFSPLQRTALAERDGGCAFCHAPVSHCATHHIKWWSKDGHTDLSNGVLLCTMCHNRVHHDGWEIRVDQKNRVWFLPPPHVDRERTPRLGGLAALTDA